MIEMLNLCIFCCSLWNIMKFASFFSIESSTSAQRRSLYLYWMNRNFFRILDSPENCEQIEIWRFNWQLNNANVRNLIITYGNWPSGTHTRRCTAHIAQPVFNRKTSIVYWILEKEGERIQKITYLLVRWTMNRMNRRMENATSLWNEANYAFKSNDLFSTWLTIHNTTKCKEKKR